MPRESANVRELKRKSISSLRTTVTAFNALDNDGRITAVLLHLQHAFEMLLKAALDRNKIAVFDKRSEKAISLESAIRLCQQTPEIRITDEEAGTIRVVDSWRDATQHWYMKVDESLLYLHVRAAVTLFDGVLQRVFDERLSEHLPMRVLPISAEPPRDIQLLVDREYERISELLKPHRRGRAEARARIRSLLAMESHVDPDASEVRQADVRRVERGIRAGNPREQVFPKLASVASDISGDGLTVTVRMVKAGGLPVTYTSDNSSVEPSAIRLVDLEKKFYMSKYDLAARAEVSKSRATAMRRHLGLDGDDDIYSHEFVFGSQKIMRYSDNALRAMMKAKDECDLEKIWAAHRPSPWELPACTQPGCADPG